MTTRLTLIDCAEKIVDDAARTLIRPDTHECLLCFVVRMIAEVGCDSSLRFALAYRDMVAPRATALESRLFAVGGFCDCELLLNGWQVDERLWAPAQDEQDDRFAEDGTDEPQALPGCFGVRRGSTRPCGIWVR